MKAITEQIIRDEIKCNIPEVYYIPTGCILTPAAREFLQQEKIRIAKEGQVLPQKTMSTDEEKQNSYQANTPSYKSLSNENNFESNATGKYVDYETGAFYNEKPEYMTMMVGNKLVRKDNPRIIFRGKLDSAQGLVVFAQSIIFQMGEQKVVDDLTTILDCLREVMRADVLDSDLREVKALGLTHEELREQSHNPQKFFNIQQCKLPDYTVGRSYALLNLIRANIREAELAGVVAYMDGKKVTRNDIVEELNRLSSAMHIMMCRYESGYYKSEN